MNKYVDSNSRLVYSYFECNWLLNRQKDNLIIYTLKLRKLHEVTLSEIDKQSRLDSQYYDSLRNQW
jgi:hypothetical protein